MQKVMDIKEEVSVGELFEAQSHLYHYTYGFMGSMCLKCAVQLGIPDIIYSHGQPITINELVSALEIDSNKFDHLSRFMRLLAHAGFFTIKKLAKDDEKEEVVGYDLTPSSKLLLKDRIPTLSPFVQAMFHPAILHTPEFFGEWFHSNDKTPFHCAYGISAFEYLSQNQEGNSLFNEAMVSDSGMLNLVIQDCKFVFEGLDSMVDVGGGKGVVAMLVSKLLPNLHCTVLDFPHVVENMSGTKNVKFVGGDMFQFIPPADAILLKLVLHAYSDEECVKVLKKCREAITSNGKKGKVIIIDIVINEKNDKHKLTELKLFYDMLIMAAFTGKEREEKEWKKLFLEAGFNHYKVTSIFGMRSLIEVYP